MAIVDSDVLGRVVKGHGNGWVVQGTDTEVCSRCERREVDRDVLLASGRGTGFIGEPGG
jgi:hypothetical protein